MNQPHINLEDLGWSSDWNGDEVNYPDSNVVGLYMMKDSDFGMYIDMETMKILEILNFGEEEE